MRPLTGRARPSGSARVTASSRPPGTPSRPGRPATTAQSVRRKRRRITLSASRSGTEPPGRATSRARLPLGPAPSRSRRPCTPHRHPAPCSRHTIRGRGPPPSSRGQAARPAGEAESDAVTQTAERGDEPPTPWHNSELAAAISNTVLRVLSRTTGRGPCAAWSRAVSVSPFPFTNRGPGRHSPLASARWQGGPVCATKTYIATLHQPPRSPR